MCISAIFLCGMMFCYGDSVNNDRVNVVKQDSIWKDVYLEKVVVEGSQVIHYPDKDVWTITKEMRKNTFDTYSLLSKIPGFYYNVFSEKLSFWGRDKILVTVDGKVKEDGYGGGLANMRFKKIEVYDHPEGQFADYEVVVNLITYEDWQGYDIRGANSATLLPSSDYGNTFSKCVENYTYTYTRPKFDVSSNLSFNHQDIRSLRTFDMIGSGMRYYSTANKSYTNIQKSNIYSMYIDIDYKINKNHTVSAKYLYNQNNGDTETNYDKVNRVYLSTGEKDVFGRYSIDLSNIKDNAISVFYTSKSNKWRLNTELTYEIYSEKNRYAYSEFTSNEVRSSFRNKRKSWFLSLDIVNDLGKKGTFSAGCLYYNRHYQSHEELQNEYFTSRLVRNKGYVNFSHNLGGRLSIRVGVIAEHLTLRNDSSKDNQMIWGANATLRYGGMQDKFSGSLVYRSSTSYPTLYQTMTIKNQIDPLLGFVGNINLKASTTHTLVLTARWGRINLNSALSYAPNQILPVYIQSDSLTFRSFSNNKNLGHSSVLSYSPKSCKFLGNNLQFRASLSYAGYYIKQFYQKEYVDYWGGQASLTYDIKDFVSMQFDYTRMTMQSLSSQTVSQKAYDFWEIQLSKNFLNHHIQCQLSYTLPIKWGVERMNYTDVITPFYRSYTSYDSYTYSKNQIMFRIVIRFAKGHIVRKQFNEQTLEKEIYNDYFD